MKGLLTFPKGGVHPPGGKSYSSSNETAPYVPPSGIYRVPLLQHLGGPAVPSVEVGASVKQGDLIGTSSGFISANIHSPVSGTVTEISEIQLATGQCCSGVVIQADGSADTVYKPSEDWRSMESVDIINLIKDSGVVGMGGAAFPTHVKISIPKGYTAEHLIINGVECEPYLTSDYRLMIEEPLSILNGIEVLQKVLSVSHVYIGIENNKPDAISVIRDQIQQLGLQITVVPLKVKYPQGDEKQLLKAILGKEVPSGKLPVELGAVVVNVSTAAAVYDAVVCKKPLYERNVTVSGKGVVHPGNYRVKVGTSIKELLTECGGFTGDPAKVVVGGPMMGFSIFDLETPVIKGTSGVLVLSHEESKKSQTTNCISCGRCVSACPMGLNPSMLFKLIDHQEFEDAQTHGLLDCKECGCCSYSCPAHIHLVNGFKAGKYELRRIQSLKK